MAVPTEQGVAGADGERVERVLDAAAELLVRWGYRRVTVEDVARHAGVGKGTVYLHVRTKDALFLTVLLRAQRRLFGDLAEQMTLDPAVALPWHMTRVLYDRLRADDVSRALYLGDGEVLGRLAHEASGTLGALQEWRNSAVREHFRLLRETGLIEVGGFTADEQIHAWGAVCYGFFATTGWPPEQDPFAPADADRRGELLDHAVRGLLGGHADGPDPDPALAARIAALYRPLLDHLDDEWRNRVR
ncbi:TetR/AcrR family transcriptional regulator [Pseudonocardia phyllosphaerae]|uniref:TetR/AcrR family transcriptional regulator n=1 Tax=Pseudonocardia phyllosphaerae TaxID=3390502 RepID=UPI00397D4771